MRVYMGINIERKTTPGYALPWSAYVNGHVVYADTLVGIKALISEELSSKWVLIWSPEGRPIAVVNAISAIDAKRKTPKPYNKFKGEVSVMSAEEFERTIGPLAPVEHRLR